MNTHSAHSVSAWMATGTRPDFPALDGPAQADICIIGAGITGLTAAYRLRRADQSVIVLDDGPVVSGETERTTAHLSNALDDRYTEIERLHGPKKAHLAADSHTVAINEIERLVDKESIDCDFERVDGYLFCHPGQSPDFLKKEHAAARRAGLPVEMTARAPLASFDTGPALRFPRQAQFHPLRYMAGLARAAARDGVRICTHTRVERIQGGAPARVWTQDGHVVTAGAVIVATHSPVNNVVVMHTKQAAYRTYVIAASLPRGAVPRLLLWDTGDPYHYVRIQPLPALPEKPAEDLLIVGGEDHKTGQADDADARYARLEHWTRERFPMIGEVRYRWSGQIMEPIDALGFIGRNPMDHANVFIATGDSGNGMTQGMIAGILLTDLITGKANPWGPLYDPRRITFRAAGGFLAENLNALGQYRRWLTPGTVTRAEDVGLNAGGILRHGLGRTAVSCDGDGTRCACSAACTHLYGVVAWNPHEQSWDCPVHGSRFGGDGTVLNGPASKRLKPRVRLN